MDLSSHTKIGVGNSAWFIRYRCGYDFQLKEFTLYTRVIFI